MKRPKATVAYAEIFLQQKEALKEEDLKEQKRIQFAETLFELDKKIAEDQAFKAECKALRQVINDYFKDTTKEPYDWQIQAAVLLSRGKNVLDIPTGFGKSHVICLAAINLMR